VERGVGMGKETKHMGGLIRERNWEVPPRRKERTKSLDGIAWEGPSQLGTEPLRLWPQSGHGGVRAKGEGGGARTTRRGMTL